MTNTNTNTATETTTTDNSYVDLLMEKMGRDFASFLFTVVGITYLRGRINFDGEFGYTRADGFERPCVRSTVSVFNDPTATEKKDQYMNIKVCFIGDRADLAQLVDYRGFITMKTAGVREETKSYPAFPGRNGKMVPAGRSTTLKTSTHTWQLDGPVTISTPKPVAVSEPVAPVADVSVTDALDDFFADAATVEMSHDLSTWSVKQLRAELRSVGMPVGGNKQALIDRLANDSSPF